MNKIAVIDLDECLCSVNTFRCWLVFSFLALFISFRWFSLFKLNVYIVMRLFRQSNRVQMKRDVLSVTESLSNFYIRYFCKFLNLFTNNRVLLEIQRLKDMNLPVVLCTAAPACYVDVYADKFDFFKVISTTSVFNGVWVENIRDEKLVSIERCFGSDVVLECVVTDHYDDLPLLLKAKKCFLVKPSKVTLNAVEGRIDYEIL